MTIIRRPHEHVGPSKTFMPRRLSPTEIEARRSRPNGDAADRAVRVRQILDDSTFTVASGLTRATRRGV